jgi:hypothetical protein
VPDADVQSLLTDLMDMNSFTAVTGELLGNEAKLHDPIYRAGIMAMPFEITGIRSESQFQTN